MRPDVAAWIRPPHSAAKDTERGGLLACLSFYLASFVWASFSFGKQTLACRINIRGISHLSILFLATFQAKPTPITSTSRAMTGEHANIGTLGPCF